MNITGGKFNGRKITTVKSNDVRPTSSKVRASIFNMLNSIGRDFEGAIFLDLFAGSAIMGLEALSRGFDKSVFVEKNSATCRLIKQNLAKFDAQYEVFNMDALKFLDKTQDLFDVIFVDPPYHEGLYDDVVAKVFQNNLLKPKGILIVEAPLEYTIPEGLSVIKEKLYGDTKIYFLK
jgi:16S rRNA (guanine(966)-N(2))-methyltransferase RsmD